MAEKATRVPQIGAAPGATPSDDDTTLITKMSAAAAALNKKKAKVEARKTNVPPEVKKRNWDAITDAIAVMSAAEKELKRAKGIVQSCYATAKLDGCNIESFKRLRREEKIDIDEFDLDMIEVARLAVIVGSPVAQTSLMKLLEETDEVNYYTQGFTAGKAGDAFTTCPYNPGTEESEKWGHGWKHGQSKLAEETLLKPPKKEREKKPGRSKKASALN